MLMRQAALGVVLAAGISAPAQAATITLEGVTTGCFGEGCSTYSDAATYGGLAFNGSAFTLEISDTSIQLLSGDFGSLALDGEDAAASAFTLHIQFTSGEFESPTADMLAIVTRAGSSGNLKVDWQDDPASFMFTNAAGPEGFTMLLGKRTVNPSGPRSLEPTLTLLPEDSQDEPPPTTEEAPPVDTVPEPGTLALVGVGLAAAIARRRRR